MVWCSLRATSGGNAGLAPGVSPTASCAVVHTLPRKRRIPTIRVSRKSPPSWKGPRNMRYIRKVSAPHCWMYLMFLGPFQEGGEEHEVHPAVGDHDVAARLGHLRAVLD